MFDEDLWPRAGSQGSMSFCTKSNFVSEYADLAELSAKFVTKLRETLQNVMFANQRLNISARVFGEAANWS